jgi:ribonuclease HI
MRKQIKMTILKIYSDGGSRGNPGPAASAFVVYKKGKIFHKDGMFIGKKTNNYAEYFALLMVFNWLIKELNNEDILVKYYLDSELVVNQLKGRYKVKSKNLIPLFSEASEKIKRFSGRIEFYAIKREINKYSDKLVNEILDENK